MVAGHCPAYRVEGGRGVPESPQRLHQLLHLALVVHVRVVVDSARVGMLSARAPGLDFAAQTHGVQPENEPLQIGKLSKLEARARYPVVREARHRRVYLR